MMLQNLPRKGREHEEHAHNNHYTLPSSLPFNFADQNKSYGHIQFQGIMFPKDDSGILVNTNVYYSNDLYLF